MARNYNLKEVLVLLKKHGAGKKGLEEPETKFVMEVETVKKDKNDLHMV